MCASPSFHLTRPAARRAFVPSAGAPYANGWVNIVLSALFLCLAELLCVAALLAAGLEEATSYSFKL